MIDTPRTDAMICNPALNQLQYVSAVFARQLERELNEAKEMNNVLARAGNSVQEERDQLHREVNTLKGEVSEWKHAAEKAETERDKLHAEVEDARQVVCNCDENAKINRELAERDVSQLRAEVERLTATCGCSGNVQRATEIIQSLFNQRDQYRTEADRLKAEMKALDEHDTATWARFVQWRECAERLADIMFCVNKQSAYYSENRQEAVNALAAFNKLKGETI